MLFILLLFISYTSLATSSISLSITVDPNSPISRPIRAEYISYGVETYNAKIWFGVNTQSPKSSLVKLIKHIMHSVRGPVIRIGGNSGDMSIWNPNDYPLPTGDTYNITQLDLLTADNAARAFNGKIVWNLNFRDAHDPQHALDHIAAIDRLIGWDHIESIELQNEPDLYTGNGMRKAPYEYEQYNAEFSAYVDAIKAKFPDTPIKYEGLAVAGEAWWPNISSYAKQHREILRSVSVHNYPLTYCNHNNATIEQLLSDRSSQQFARDIENARLVQALDAVGIPLFLGEANSASCFGIPGVSNAFASSLWIVDYLFNLARIGVQRVNVMAQPAVDNYSPFTWLNADSDVPIVQPLYYGLAMFARAARGDVRIVSTQFDQSLASFLKIWSCRSHDELSVVLLHKNDTQDAVRVAINVTAPVDKFEFPVAELRVMTSPSLHELFNVSFAGLTWMNTTNGDPSGKEHIIRIKPIVDASGAFAVYQVDILPASGALVQLQMREQPLSKPRRHSRPSN